MARTKSEKKEIMDKVKKVIDDSSTIVFVNFHGLKVADATAIRRKLKSDGVGFFVAKKTLTKKALEGKKYEGTIPELGGELGLAYSKDLVAPARGIYEFQKKLKDSISILGGVFEGVYKTKDEMVAIAAIPSQHTLQAMFVNVINSPIQGFVMALSEVAKKKTA